MSEETKRPVCEVCGREAIGVQSLGCYAATVCAEHAEPQLREAKPGETIAWGVCAFQRFQELSGAGGKE
jgi:hypothetical protein